MLPVTDILPLQSGSVFKNVDLVNLKFYSKKHKNEKNISQCFLSLLKTELKSL